MRAYHNWTDKERDIVRMGYDGSKERVNELAHRLNVTRGAIKSQAAYLGVTKQSTHRLWSDKEKETLGVLIQQYEVRRVAQVMHRSIGSVASEVRRLKLSRRMRDGWFTMGEVCEVLGVSIEWVKVRIGSGALKARSHYEGTPADKGGSCWHIELEDLRDFIKRYPRELVGRNVDLVLFVDILSGYRKVR